MTRKTTICATFTEKLAIKALLDERLHPVEGTETGTGAYLFRYEEGWNDEVVAKTVREALSANITAKIRNECFGKLHNQGKKSGQVSGSTKARVEMLEAKLELLIDWMQAYGGLPQAERDLIDVGCAALLQTSPNDPQR